MPPPEAPTVSLIAEPETIERGKSATLKWSSTGATDLTLSGIGDVASAGIRQVQPTESTTYVLTAKGPGGVHDGDGVRECYRTASPRSSADCRTQIVR